MPLVEVSLASGRTPEQLRSLITEVTRAVSSTVGAPAKNLRVLIREIAPELWAAGDVTIHERNAPVQGSS
jgi:4-oxalocrotonate tautomerase